MKLLRKISQKSILTTWLLSYLLVLFLPILMGVILLFQSVYASHKQLMYYNNSISAALISENDRSVVEQMQAVTMASADDEIQASVHMETPISPEEQKILYSLKEKMSNYNMKFFAGTNNQKCFIVLKGINRVVDSKFVSETEQYYRKNYDEEGKDFEAWLSAVFDNKSGYFLKTLPDGAVKICYVASFPDAASVRGAFVIERELPDLNKIISERVNNTLLTECAAFAGNGDMIFSTHKLSDLSAEELTALAERDDEHVRIDGQKYYLCTQTSDETGLKYMVAVSDLTWNKMIFSIRMFGILMLLVSVIGGLVFIFFVVRYNYAPIKSIMENVHGRIPMNGKQSQNELEIIQDALSNIINEYITVSKRADTQAEKLKKHVICDVLLGELKTNDLKELDVDFRGKKFAVALFEFEDYERLFEGEDDISEAEKFSTILFVLENIVRDVFKNGSRGYVTRIDSRVALLLTLDNYEKSQKKIRLFDTLLDVKHFMEENMYIRCTISLSSIVSTVDEIEIAYREACEALQYKLSLGTEIIITQEGITVTDKRRYVYSLEKEQKLINYIKTSDSEKAVELIEEIFKEGDLSLDMLKCLAYGMVGTIFRITDSEGDEEFEELSRKLLGFETIMELKEMLISETQKMCERYQPKKGDFLCARVKKVVEEQYSNPDLSVGYIAEILGVQYAYLSAAFKSYAGEGVLEYISRFRIDRSKELLKDPLMSVDNVAKKVGYTTSKTFIRVFKKLEGVTPASYRKHAVSEQ
ncbi:MAG: helix-turn-helix domain-containing protein [Clostridia bacterium]|nr:helix-turn-helix domain-containing protein [Clostridia bacterium]